jgi:ArsR family transcriptional regulator
MIIQEVMNMAEGSCLENTVHPEKIEKARGAMPPDKILREMTELFKVLADETRMRIISALSGCELCVCDLSAMIEVSQSAVSHQLRILRQARLVKYRREGRNAFYMLDDEHVETIALYARNHVQESFYGE